ncbi:hypothetical protein [Hymenobacter cheonanensis]|uniref:hypothetical protein n=1 Tax=Hymenobacter sp. CA2-7 TaxID=3063993 RepID=UPI0027125FDB|nr:hypothetical protein [Hymenobacter sp. CA2-7]MDO7883752.1 hypothetical protein [Hymenobacter sp. CA2-7]
MDAALYFDDFEEGITRETSHPVFTGYATADFFYSQGDDFSPFGNDTGNDTLRFLEDWYQERRAGEKAATFLRKMVDEWGFGGPYVLITDPAKFESINWDEKYLTDTVDQAIISIAFGQFKIAGKADKAIISLAAHAFQRQRYLAEKAKIHPTNPWNLADEYLARLSIMECSLDAMVNKKAR